MFKNKDSALGKDSISGKIHLDPLNSQSSNASTIFGMWVWITRKDGTSPERDYPSPETAGPV